MIGTIVIGSGNARKVHVRDRNRQQSINFAHAICQYVGIPRGGAALRGSYKGKRPKAA